MNFRFDTKRATQASAYLIKKYRNTLDYMKLIKLLYLANREALQRFRQVIVPDTFVSMKYGPVLSITLNEITQPSNKKDYWSQHISAPSQYKISLLADPGVGELSRRFLEVLDEVDERWHKVSKWAMVDWMHKNLGEWKDPGDGMIPISVRSLMREIGVPKEEQDQLIEDELLFSEERDVLVGLS